MGKFKHLMCSLRSKLTSSKSNSKKSPVTTANISSISPSSLSPETGRGSIATLQTYGSFPSEVQTLPTTPPKTPPRSTHLHVAEGVPGLNADVTEGTDDAARVHLNTKERGLSAHAALEVNTAMLDFAKKLPLEELSMIGRGSSLYSRSGFEQAGSSYEEDTEVSSPVTADSHIPSRALSLEEGSINSSWSFTCRSARRIERECEHSYDNDDAFSFGSLAGWGMMCNEEAGHDLVDHGGENSESSVDNEDRMDSSRNLLSAPHSACSAASPSFAEQTSDSYGSFLTYIGTPDIGSPRPIMSEEQFDALPDWSDVEDNPEYDTFFIKQPVSWSSTASSSSCNATIDEHRLGSRRASELSGHLGDSTIHGHASPTSLVTPTVKRATVTRRGEKRKRYEPDELDSASKKVKRTVERRKRRVSTTRLGRRGGFTM